MLVKIEKKWGYFFNKFLSLKLFSKQQSSKTLVIKKNDKEYKVAPYNIIWNVLIYGSLAAVGILLIFIYSGYIFINK